MSLPSLLVLISTAGLITAIAFLFKLPTSFRTLTMKYPFRGTHSGLTSPPSDIDLLTGSPVGRITTMAEAVDGSAVIPTGPVSPPPTPPELPTAAGKDVPRSVPHSVTEYGNHYIYLRDPSVPRHIQSSNVEGKGGEGSACADHNSHDARFCLSAHEWPEDEMGYDNGQLPGTTRADYAHPNLHPVMNGSRSGERGGAGRTPPAAPAPELRSSHGEGPERFFPSRAGSSSPRSFHDSSGATISGNIGSHRQAGVPFVSLTRGKSIFSLELARCVATWAESVATWAESVTSLSPCIPSEHLLVQRDYPPQAAVV